PAGAAEAAPGAEGDAGAREDVAAGADGETGVPQGGLAETGSGLGLWPAAVGGVLFAGGCVLLVRSRRHAR
ncbi:LPXTG cell wall anchor domain-containing protein, partial [Streptomyces rochei]|uniref:LPXTG cell wall anchor domain-containing protein n=1 Tax=Streptomyces rochei TaxID=1928 RepID=UPI001EF389DA